MAKVRAEAAEEAGQAEADEADEADEATATSMAAVNKIVAIAVAVGVSADHKRKQ